MNTVSQIFPRTGRISGPEVGDGAKPDVPTTDRENEKKKQLVFYEAVNAHRCLIIIIYLKNILYFLQYNGIFVSRL